MIFKEPPIIEMWNKCHWIWHALDPPLKPFWCIFSSQIQQNMKFLPEILIFQEMLIVETQNLPLDSTSPKYSPLKPFQCILASQNQQNVKFLVVCLTPPDKKWKICQFVQGKSVWKGLKICTYRFLGMPITVHYVRTLCEKYFVELWWFFLIFDRKFMYRVLKHCVGVELDQRRIAAYVPFHFDGFQPHFMLLIS